MPLGSSILQRVSKSSRAIAAIAMAVSWTAAVVVAQVAPPAVQPGAAAQPAAAQTQPAGPPPKFRCDEMEYKWGTVWAMEKVEYEYIIHNDGEGILNILDVKASCGCTATEYDKNIAPGGQGKIKAVLTTGNYSTTLTKTITVTTNDPQNKMVVLKLTGEVKQRISSDPYLTAQFGQLVPGASLTKTFKLTNNTDKPMKLEVTEPAQPSCFKVSIKEIEAGKVAELTVTAEPPFKEDANYAAFSIKTGMEGVPDLPLPCNLFKPPTIQISPPQLRLPTVAVANPYKTSLTLRNNGEEPLKLVSATVNDERIKVEPKEVQPGKLWSIAVEVPAGYKVEPGQAPVVTITTDYEPKPVYTVAMLPMVQPQVTPPTPAFTTPEAMVGRMAPGMPIQTMDGRQLRVGPGSNQVMLVNFWASWCPASREQLSMLDQLYQTYRRRGVEFINISVEQYRPQTELAEIIRGLDSKIPVGLDFDRRITQAFNVTELPTTFLIGRNGIVEAVRRGIGRSEQELDTIADMFEDQLDKLTEGKNRSEFKMLPVSLGATCRLQQLPSSPTAAQGPVLGVEALSQDAGLFKPGVKAEYKLYYRNTGTQALEIKSIKAASPGLTVDESYAKNLAPGATAFVTCRFDTPPQPIPFVHQLAIESNGAIPTLNVAVSGKSRPYIEVQMAGRTVEFTTGVRTFSVPRLATLIYNGPEDVKVEYKNAKSSSPKFEATVETRATMGLVTIRALPPFEQGEHKATIAIETNIAEQAVVEVPVRLFMPPRVEVKPASIEMTAARGALQFPISIINSGTTALNILGIDKSNDAIQTQFYPEPDGLSYKLQVTLPPNFICRPEGEKVTLRTDDTEYAQIVIPIHPGAVRGPVRQLGTAPLPVPK